MTARRSCRLVAGLGVLLVMGALGPVPAQAATPSPVEPSPSSSAGGPASTADSGATPSTTRRYQQDPSGFALLVSPTRLVIAPQDLGSTQRITVVNRSAATIPVTAQKRNFTPGADGSLQYGDDAPYAAADWLTLSPASFELAPGAEQVVTATLDVPDEPDPGDHQVAVVFLVPSAKGGGNVKINRGIGLPTYITVPGPTDDSVSLDALRAPRLVAWGSVDVGATVHNTGTVHRDFRGGTRLAVEGGSHDGQFPDFTVPRGATRDLTGSWDPPLVCVCTLTVGIDNAAGRQEQSTRIIVFPWPVALGGLGLLLVVLLAVRLGRRSFRTRVLRAAALQNAAEGSSRSGPVREDDRSPAGDRSPSA
jgi:hypothetical protein